MKCGRDKHQANIIYRIITKNNFILSNGNGTCNISKIAHTLMKDFICLEINLFVVQFNEIWVWNPLTYTTHIYSANQHHLLFCSIHWK